MGYSGYISKSERTKFRRSYKQQLIRQEQITKKRRLTIATKIADRIIGKINNDIIRPGPKSEERECTFMAQELRDLKPELIDTIFTALKKDKKKKGRN